MDKQERTTTREVVPDSCEIDVVNLKTDIPEALKQWVLDTYTDIDNPSQLTQLQFNAGLMYIYNTCVLPILHNNKSVGNRYSIQDIKILSEVLEVYIELCMMYDKHICLFGYSFISGVSVDVLGQWEVDRKASREQQELAKNIRQLDEESLKDLLVTGKRNPVGVVAVLNNRHGWSSTRVEHISTENRLENADIVAKICG